MGILSFNTSLVFVVHWKFFNWACEPSCKSWNILLLHRFCQNWDIGFKFSLEYKIELAKCHKNIKWCLYWKHSTDYNIREVKEHLISAVTITSFDAYRPVEMRIPVLAGVLQWNSGWLSCTVVLFEQFDLLFGDVPQSIYVLCWSSNSRDHQKWLCSFTDS